MTKNKSPRKQMQPRLAQSLTKLKPGETVLIRHIFDGTIATQCVGQVEKVPARAKSTEVLVSYIRAESGRKVRRAAQLCHLKLLKVADIERIATLHEKAALNLRKIAFGIKYKGE